MTKFLFVTIVVLAVYGFNAVNAGADEYLEVKCVVAAPNKIYVRLDKDTVAVANEIAKQGNIDNFRSHMKDVIKNIPHKNKTCFLGWIGEQDMTTAMSMFVSGITEFKHVASKIEASGYPFLYMNTERGQSYDHTWAHFNLGF
jgi:hypothetical protein